MLCFVKVKLTSLHLLFLIHVTVCRLDARVEMILSLVPLSDIAVHDRGMPVHACARATQQLAWPWSKNNGAISIALHNDCAHVAGHAKKPLSIGSEPKSRACFCSPVAATPVTNACMPSEHCSWQVCSTFACDAQCSGRL